MENAFFMMQKLLRKVRKREYTDNARLFYGSPAMMIREIALLQNKEVCCKHAASICG
jgi:hypothetical protein